LRTAQATLLHNAVHEEIEQVLNARDS